MSPDVVNGVRRMAEVFAARNPLLRDDIDDLCQEALLRVWQTGEEPSWPGTARHAMIDWLRHTYGRKGWRRRLVARWESLDQVSADRTVARVDTLAASDDPASRAVARDELARTLGTMPPRTRRWAAQVAAGATLRRIGAGDGVSESRVCMVLARYRGGLR